MFDIPTTTTTPDTKPFIMDMKLHPRTRELFPVLPLIVNSQVRSRCLDGSFRALPEHPDLHRSYQPLTVGIRLPGREFATCIASAIAGGNQDQVAAREGRPRHYTLASHNGA